MKIFNLSNKILSSTKISILLKGLKFTPTPEKRNIEEIKTDLAEFHRKLRLKEFFLEYQNNEDDSIVRNKSFFEPPKNRNVALDQFIDITKRFPFENLKNNPKYNLTLNERKSITSLKNDKSIVIKEADKGGGIVIMNTDYYKQKIMKMLEDDTFYKSTNDNCNKATFKKIRELIKLSKDITRHEIDYLLNFEFKSSLFYGLPKIHKSKLIKTKCKETTTNYLELVDPEDLTFRPIVAGTICETHRLSNLIDILIKPFTKHNKLFKAT